MRRDRERTRQLPRIEPERLVYDHLPGPKFNGTAIFEDKGGKTRLTMRAVFDTVAERINVAEKFGAVEGGKQTLARLAGHLPKMSAGGHLAKGQTASISRNTGRAALV